MAGYDISAAGSSSASSGATNSGGKSFTGGNNYSFPDWKTLLIGAAAVIAAVLIWKKLNK